MNIRAYGKTDKGLVREKNEDSYYLNDHSGIFAVADGLGGLPRGAEASELAIQLLEEMVGIPEETNGKVDLTKVFSQINKRVFEAGKLASGEIGMGTTLTSARIRDNLMDIAHVGDTAVFRFRGDQWDQLTIDHTMEQEIRDRLQPGEEAFIPDYFSHTLTRCIGQGDDIQPDVYHVEMQTGDRYLICSDGVTKTMQPEELSRLIWDCQSPEQFVKGLITLANNRGGPDNVTAIALFVD